MRSTDLLQARNTITITDKFESHNSTMETSMTIDVASKIKDKIKTFTNWNFRSALTRRRRSRASANNFVKQNTGQIQIEKALISFAILSQNDENKKKIQKKNTFGLQQLQGVKTQRRQRFKKARDASQIIKHFQNKEGYIPKFEQKILLQRLVDIKNKTQSIQPFNLQKTLQRLIKTMNIAVDLNQVKFLLLAIEMTGEICYQAKELKTSFYFYQKAMRAATYYSNFRIKLQSFIYMGLICIQLLEHLKAIIFFKKALQYAWKIKDIEIELRLYDLIGKCYYYEGRLQQASYYHDRYIQGQIESNQSAVRRISFQMLTQYQKTLDIIGDKQNLTQLFLSYLRIPIYNFTIYPPNKISKIYPNYINNSSPRINGEKVTFDYNELPQVEAQIHKILNQCPQFQTQIPNPDLHQNFISNRKYGRHKKDIQFEQSNNYHKIKKVEIKKIDKSILKLPIDQKINKILGEKHNPNWWQNILIKSKKQRNQKLGSIRNKIQKSHLSYDKYSQQKKRAQSLKSQKILETFNKTILNIIDPPKK